jgi:carboxymethylenebutenolidase
VAIFGVDVQVANSTFESEGRSITVEQFIPAPPGRYPAVIALYGSGGLREGWADQPSRLLAGQGFSVFLVHYFDRTGTLRADRETTHASFPLWMRTIGDGISFAGRHASVDANRVALLGFSLGAYLALSVASVDPRVRAVVEFFGGIPEELHGFTRMPPVLILHGENDQVVPVSEAHALQRLMERSNLAYEMKLYPGAGHGFSPLQFLDAGQRTLQFLRKNL